MIRWLPLVMAMLILGAVPAAAQVVGPDAPLHISADNMSGSHGPEGDEVLLNGNVRITRGRTVLTADHGRYLRTQGMLYLDGDITLEDSTTTVTCDRASYAEDADVIELGGDVTLVDRDATLSAPAATYDRRHGRAELYGGVSGSDRHQRLSCDRAIYHRATRLLEARGNVKGRDIEHDLELRATAVDFDRTAHQALASGNPSLRVKDGKGKEAVIRAVRLKLDTETRVAEAIDSVRVERDTLRARGDYGIFDDAANHGWLLGSPRVWDDENSVTGDTLELWSEKRELRRVVVRGHAVMDFKGTRPENRGETNRLVGDRMDAYFTDEEIDSLVAVGNARNEYQALPERGKTAESNAAKGDTITVFFDGREIDRARVEGKATGEYLTAADVRDTAKTPPDLVRYDAARIDYIVSRNVIVLDRKAHLVFRDLELTADRVEYNVDQQTLLASGEPELVDRGDKVTGHLMTYDLETRIGNIYSAETTYEKGLYHGQRIRKVTDDQLDILNGAYSTCDLPEPHYHFQAHWMKIYLKNKLIAKPVVFYIKKVPILALPFWIFPIRPGRHSGFMFPQFVLGFTNRAGQFIRNAGYYWAPNDYIDVALSGDYYQFEPSWVIRAESMYKLLYVLDGNVRGSFARNDRLQTEDWDFNADHSHVLGPNTRLSARGAFVSSRDYNSSNLYGRSLSQRLNRFLRSSLSLSHQMSWANINAALDRNEDLDADESITDPDGEGPLEGPPPGRVASLPNLSQSVPVVSVSFPTRALGSLPMLRNTRFGKPLSTMYFDLDTRFVSQYTRTAFVSGYRSFVRDSVPDSTTIISQRVSTRRGFAANTSLSDARRAFGWLNLRPSLFATAVVFDFDELGHKVVPTGVWSSGLTASTTFYGTFRPGWGSLDGIRHVIFPSLSLSYSPEFPHLIYRDSLGRTQDRFRSFGGIGVSGFKQFRMNFGLDQRVQLKLVKGDQVQKLDNFLSWGLNGSYNFLYREQGQRHPLSGINSNILVQPPGILSANLTWLTDVYSPRPVQSLGFNTGVSLSSSRFQRKRPPSLPVEGRESVLDEDISSNEDWSVDLAYSYSGGYPEANQWESSQTGNAVVHYQITPAWTFEYSASYDVTLREVGTQRFALSRDLHCWTATFTRTFAPGGEAEYYFRLGVKDQKEIYLERGTRTGSIGGIN